MEDTPQPPTEGKSPPSCPCKTGSSNEKSRHQEKRRGFFAQAAALLAGTIALAAPTVTGIVAFLNPLRQKSQKGQFIRLTSIDALPEDGTPRRFPVIADRTDAWNRFPNQPIGAVFLRRNPDREKSVEALHVVCPHAGCFLEYRETPEGGKFYCPCHGANFDLTGKRLEKDSQSPRPMDTLEVDPQQLQNGQVWVKFKNFRTGTSEKIEIT